MELDVSIVLILNVDFINFCLGYRFLMLIFYRKINAKICLCRFIMESLRLMVANVLESDIVESKFKLLCSLSKCYPLDKNKPLGPQLNSRSSTRMTLDMMPNGG